VTTEVAGRGELTQPVADHVLGHKDRDVAAAIVHGERQTNHLGMPETVVPRLISREIYQSTLARFIESFTQSTWT